MKKNICSIDFSRIEGKQLLKIKVTPELERLFTTDETETSEVYKDSEGEGLEFYKLSKNLEKYTAKYNSGAGYNAVILSRYGTDLFIENMINVSILRTVDVSGEIEVVVDDLIVDTEVQKWIQELAKYIKYIHTNFIEKTEVKATINLEF